MHNYDNKVISNDEYKREEDLDVKNSSNKIAKIVTKCLEKVLQIEANTASSAIYFQPKAPAELKKFRSAK